MALLLATTRVATPFHARDGQNGVATLVVARIIHRPCFHHAERQILRLYLMCVFDLSVVALLVLAPGMGVPR